MLRLRKLLAFVLSLALLLPSVIWKSDGVASAQNVSDYVRLKNQWKGTYLYEADGKVRYGFPVVTDQAAQWLVETEGTHQRIKNRATGHYLNMQNEIASDHITDPVESGSVADAWTSDQWTVAAAAGQPGYYNVVSVDYPNRLLNVQIQNGFAQANDWAQPAWGSALWLLEPAAEQEPVRLKDQWKGNYLYEDAGQVKYGTPELNDPASQWFVVDDNGYKRLQNRATGHEIVTVDPTGGGAAQAVDGASTGAQWRMADAGDGYFTFQSADNAASYLNVQSQDGYAHGNDWAQSTWGSAKWKLETAADTTPKRLKDQWKGQYLFEQNGQVAYGNPSYDDPASQWIVEDAGAQVRLRNVSTGRYIATVDHAGGSPAVTDAVYSASAASYWNRGGAKDGDGNGVDGYFTFQSAVNAASYLNVQSQDGYAHGNNWAQPTWGSAQWKLEDPAPPSGDSGEPSIPYIRIKNNWLQLYLYEKDGIVHYGNAKADDRNAQWLIVAANGKKRIQNRATGHYITLEGHTGARDLLHAADIADGSALGDWVIEDYQGFKEIHSAGDANDVPGSQSYIHVENKLKGAQYGIVPRDWGSPKWEFVPVEASAAPSYVRLKNDYRNNYLYEEDGKVKFGTPDAKDPSSHWAFVDSTLGKRIVNRATGHSITVEHVQTYNDPVESLDLDPTWGSVQWTIDAVANSDAKVLRNVWKTDWILHEEDNKGFVQASALDPAWGSGHWLLEPAPELPPELPSGPIRIQNKANGKYLYENGSQVVVYGTPSEGDATSHWLLESSGETVRVKNRATGHYLSMENLKPYLETSVTADVYGGRAEWAVEKAAAGSSYLLRSLASGHEDEYVHAEDNQGYPQHELRSVESSGVQWAFRPAPADAFVPPADTGPATLPTRVFADPNYVKLRNELTGGWLYESGGALALGSPAAQDRSAQWQFEEINGRKRLKNRLTGHYLAASTGRTLRLSATGSGDSAEWSLAEMLGALTLTSAESPGQRLAANGGTAALAADASAASRWFVTAVAQDVIYEAESAFHAGGAAGSRVIFAVNAAAEGAYTATLRFANTQTSPQSLSLIVNGLKQTPLSLPVTQGRSWGTIDIVLPLREGMNTVALQNDTGTGGLADIDRLTVRDAVAPAFRGATMPYVAYEAEDGATNGTLIGPDRSYYTIAAESSGRKAVRLDTPGQYVEFRTSREANAMTLRYVIPDSPDGLGQTATISLYVNGTFQKKLTLSSRHNWVYGKYPWSNDPTDGDAHRFYDEIHQVVGDIPAGATVRLQKDAGDGADYYVIDLAELEQAPNAYGLPAGYLSAADYGAAADDGADDTDALKAAMADARSQGKGLWIPAGTFDLKQGPLDVSNVTIRGAGMWHTLLKGAGFMGTGSNVGVYDLSIDVGVTGRHDELPESGFDGTFGTGSTIQNVWIEHAKAGIWTVRSEDGIATDGLYIGNVRIRDTYADGVHFSTGTKNSRVEQSQIRNTGDDAIALWSNKPDGVSDQEAQTDSNTVRFNTVQLPWLADNIAVFGGKDNRIQDNLVSDTMGFGAGIAVSSRFNPVPFGGTTIVERNTLIRAGGREFNWNQDFGAIWLFTGDKAIDADIAIRDNTVLDSTFQGLYINGPFGINTAGGHKVSIENLVIDTAGTWGIHVNSSVTGSVETNNVIIRNAKVGRMFNAVGDAFAIRDVTPVPPGNPDPGPSGNPKGNGTGGKDGGVSDNDMRLEQAAAAGDKVIIFKADTAKPSAETTVSLDALRKTGKAVKDAVIRLEYGDAAYELPIGVLDTVLQNNDVPFDPSSGTLTMKIMPAAPTIADAMKKAAQSTGAALVGSPMIFEVSLQSGNSVVPIRSFGRTFVTRTLTVEEEIDSSAASVVVFDPDTGSFRPVPALFRKEGNRTVVTVRSVTNSLYGVIVNRKSFEDLEGHWARKAIELLAAKGIVSGRSKAAFVPEAKVTRAEFAAMLVKALGLPETAASGGVSFADVKPAAWYAGTVRTASAYGLVNGFADGTFRPERTITREEMAVMLAAALKMAVPSDAAQAETVDWNARPGVKDRVSGWAEPAVREALRSGVMTGRSADTFAPREPATRAEAASVLSRLLVASGLADPVQ